MKNVPSGDWVVDGMTETRQTEGQTLVKVLETCWRQTSDMSRWNLVFFAGLRNIYHSQMCKVLFYSPYLKCLSIFDNYFYKLCAFFFKIGHLSFCGPNNFKQKNFLAFCEVFNRFKELF